MKRMRVLGTRFAENLTRTLRTDIPKEMRDDLVPRKDQRQMALCHRTLTDKATLHIQLMDDVVALQVWPSAFAGLFPIPGLTPNRELVSSVWGEVYYRADRNRWVSWVFNLPEDTDNFGQKQEHRTFEGALCRCRLLVKRSAPEPVEDWEEEFLKNIPPLENLFPTAELVKEYQGPDQREWRASYCRHYVETS